MASDWPAPLLAAHSSIAFCSDLGIINATVTASAIVDPLAAFGAVFRFARFGRGVAYRLSTRSRPAPVRETLSLRSGRVALGCIPRGKIW
jgi:hypothetical protein